MHKLFCWNAVKKWTTVSRMLKKEVHVGKCSYYHMCFINQWQYYYCVVKIFIIKPYSTITMTLRYNILLLQLSRWS